MRVALLPTGRTEWHGLPGALRSLFPADPSHEFYVVPTGEEIRSNPDGFPYPGFTSTMLGERHEVSPPEAAYTGTDGRQAATTSRFTRRLDPVLRNL